MLMTKTPARTARDGGARDGGARKVRMGNDGEG